MTDFSNEDYFKAIVHYGLNQSTYKIGLAKTLLYFAKLGQHDVHWSDLSKQFYWEYKNRIDFSDPIPQQMNPARRTVVEQILLQDNDRQISQEQAIEEIGKNAFNDVLPRFHHLNKLDIQGKFYTFEEGKKLTLTDDFLGVTENKEEELIDEVGARWSLLEGSCCANHSTENYVLANEILTTYYKKGYKRRSIVHNIPLLNPFQGNRCFYCTEKLVKGNIEVDHLLPRSVVQHDEIWNLVLSHVYCNKSKDDKVVGQHFIEKLFKRNENIIGGRFTKKQELINKTGNTPKIRRNFINHEYENVKIVKGEDYWRDINYNPETDVFYRKLITVMNNA